MVSSFPPEYKKKLLSVDYACFNNLENFDEGLAYRPYFFFIFIRKDLVMR